ncbi:hypothetical protein AB1Y20_013297 [Prymnesium parvum]|uniref:Uncharacterized protein n=1 Tax=Prymnesium parvum TaxID=97485 RepID=A0AB34IK97_PRYPA
MASPAPAAPPAASSGGLPARVAAPPPAPPACRSPAASSDALLPRGAAPSPALPPPRPPDSSSALFPPRGAVPQPPPPHAMRRAASSSAFTAPPRRPATASLLADRRHSRDATRPASPPLEALEAERGARRTARCHSAGGGRRATTPDCSSHGLTISIHLPRGKAASAVVSFKRDPPLPAVKDLSTEQLEPWEAVLPGSTAQRYLAERLALETCSAQLLQDAFRQMLRRQASSRNRNRHFDYHYAHTLRMDDKAIAAGATGHVNYSSDMILRRTALRTENQVLAALEKAWVACANICAKNGLMSVEGYASMSRRLYLLLRLEDAAEEHAAMGKPDTILKVEIDPQDCLSTIEEDFAEDSKGKSHITQNDFYDCFFQLADLYTDGASAKQYAEWIQTHVNQIVSPYNGVDSDLLPTVEWEWKRDAEIIVSVSGRVNVRVPVFSKFAWEAFFDGKLKREFEHSNARIQAALSRARRGRSDESGRATPVLRSRPSISRGMKSPQSKSPSGPIQEHFPLQTLALSTQVLQLSELRIAVLSQRRFSPSRACQHSSTASLLSTPSSSSRATEEMEASLPKNKQSRERVRAGSGGEPAFQSSSLGSLTKGRKGSEPLAPADACTPAHDEGAAAIAPAGIDGPDFVDCPGGFSPSKPEDLCCDAVGSLSEGDGLAPQDESSIDAGASDAEALEDSCCGALAIVTESQSPRMSEESFCGAPAIEAERQIPCQPGEDSCSEASENVPGGQTFAPSGDDGRDDPDPPEEDSFCASLAEESMASEEESMASAEEPFYGASRSQTRGEDPTSPEDDSFCASVAEESTASPEESFYGASGSRTRGEDSTPTEEDSFCASAAEEPSATSQEGSLISRIGEPGVDPTPPEDDSFCASVREETSMTSPEGSCYCSSRNGVRGEEPTLPEDESFCASVTEEPSTTSPEDSFYGVSRIGARREELTHSAEEREPERLGVADVAGDAEGDCSSALDVNRPGIARQGSLLSSPQRPAFLRQMSSRRRMVRALSATGLLALPPMVAPHGAHNPMMMPTDMPKMLESSEVEDVQMKEVAAAPALSEMRPREVAAAPLAAPAIQLEEPPCKDVGGAAASAARARVPLSWDYLEKRHFAPSAEDAKLSLTENCTVRTDAAAIAVADLLGFTGPRPAAARTAVPDAKRHSSAAYEQQVSSVSTHAARAPPQPPAARNVCGRSAAMDDATSLPRVSTAGRRDGSSIARAHPAKDLSTRGAATKSARRTHFMLPSQSTPLQTQLLATAASLPTLPAHAQRAVAGIEVGAHDIVHQAQYRLQCGKAIDELVNRVHAERVAEMNSIGSMLRARSTASL